MAKGKRIDNVVALWGGPDAIATEFRTLKRSTRRLSGSKPRLIDEYPNQWVAIYGGDVCAHGESFKSVVAAAKKKGCPLDRTVIRYISRYRRAMFL